MTSKHLAPFSAAALDKIDRAGVVSYLLAKKRDGFSAKMTQNHLNFCTYQWRNCVSRLAVPGCSRVTRWNESRRDTHLAEGSATLSRRRCAGEREAGRRTE
jgi:hypothetical protein